MQWSGYWNETLLRWYSEGLSLPKAVTWQEFYSPPFQADPVKDFFGFEQPVEFVPIDFGPIPRFVSRVVEENMDYRIIIDEMGVKKMVLKDRESIPQFFEFPVKTREDWEKMKVLFDPEDPRRYPKTWGREISDYYNGTDRAIGIREYPYLGIFSMARWLMGPKTLLISFYTDPSLVKDMFNFFADFQMRTAERALKEIKIDFVSFFEDMAYKNGPHISPRMFREFMLPCYEKLVSFFKNHGVDIVMVDSDGDTRLLLPLFIEAGVNCHWPLEAQANMDAVALRKEFGRKLAFIGNIDKRVLAAGKKAIERELEYKLPELIEEEGYIPCVDHGVPPNVSFEDYSYYVSLLKKRIFRSYS